MIDINTILTQALTTAVAEATKPLVERITTLETKLALTNATLPAEQAVQIDAVAAAEALNSQEWFWEKISRYITNYSDITVDELHNIKQRLSDAEDQLSGAGDAVDVLKDQLKNIETTVDTKIDTVKGLMADAIEMHLDNAPHIGHNVIEAKITSAIENHEEGKDHLDENDINSLIETAIDSHEENKTHGDNDDIEEIVQKLLNSASISISV